MPPHSRNKGAAAEREVAEILRKHGFLARRDGRLEQDIQHDIPGVWLEIKRRETLALSEWLEQAERDAGERVPWVVFRRSRQPWRAVVPLEWLLQVVRSSDAA